MVVEECDLWDVRWPQEGSHMMDAHFEPSRPIKLSWHPSWRKFSRPNLGHVFRPTIYGDGLDEVGNLSYQVFPSVFDPFFSASRSSCAALNCEQITCQHSDVAHAVFLKN
jgi:hypothetical protein